jgi:hypothetical protein
MVKSPVNKKEIRKVALEPVSLHVIVLMILREIESAIFSEDKKAPIGAFAPARIRCWRCA